MISLETFKKLMNAIKKQEELDDKLTDLLVCKECNGWISSASGLVDAVFESLEKELEDKYEYLSWYLYDIDDGDKYVYHDEENIKYDLNKLDDLYYYIIGEYDKVKQEPYTPTSKPVEFTRVPMEEVMKMAEETWRKE